MKLFQAPKSNRDHQLCTAVETHDVQVQSAVASSSSGPNPIAPQDPSLLPTPGMDWLERMKAADEALQRRILENDNAVRKE